MGINTTGVLLTAMVSAFGAYQASGSDRQAQPVASPMQSMSSEISQKPSAKRPIVVAIGASTGIGLSYLPMAIMEKHKLLEKHAAALGLDATMKFVRYPTAEPMYDALVSGKIDLAEGGITQLLTSWDKTRANVKIKGVAALDSMPLCVVTSNPKVRTVSDFTTRDRIAMVAVHTSIEAVVLEMASEEAAGPGQANKLDALTVALGHPASMAALLSRNSSIDAHVASAPFMYEELAAPGMHKVIDSYQVLGGPHTHNLAWTTNNFYKTNPKVVMAFRGALQEALDEIKARPAAAAALYVSFDHVKDLSAAQIETIIRKPENEWTMIPKKFMAFASFMKHVGLISNMPGDWHQLFFEDVKDGS